MKQVFVVYGGPETGKSILFNEVVKANFLHDYNDVFYLRTIDKNNIKSIVLDDFIVTDDNCKDLVLTIDRLYKNRLDYLTIITNCGSEDLYKLTSRLKMLDIPISVCEMKRCE